MIPMTAVMPDTDITARQRRILSFIAEFLAERGYPPTVREIGEAIGLASTSSVHYQLTKLQRLGLIERDGNRSRTVTIVQVAA